MKKRIRRTMNLLCLGCVVLSAALLLAALYFPFDSERRERLSGETALVAAMLERVEDPLALLADGALPTPEQDIRVSYIAPDGTVLYDSGADAASMENHLDREEVALAHETGYGASSRISETLGTKTYYRAQRLQNGAVLRLSYSSGSVYAMLLRVLWVLLPLMALLYLICVWIAAKETGAILKPLLVTDPLSENQPLAYDELAPLVNRIRRQQAKINTQEKEAARRREEFLRITDTMAEGLMVLDGQKRVLSINRSALRLLRAPEGSHPEMFYGKTVLLLDREPAFAQMLEEVLACKHAERVLPQLGVQFLADPALQDGQTIGATVLLTPLTDRQKAEQLRREFTGNVSHELKTPLTSISGFAELMMNGLVAQKDIPDISARIHREAQRLIALVADIMKLSRLDEGAQMIPQEQVELAPLLLAQKERLAPRMEQKQLRFALEGEAPPVRGAAGMLEELFFNLLDNAVKYNKQGGSVTVTLGAGEDGGARVVVSDSGLGIPKEAQQRVFERFYRVDQSRNKTAEGEGGTGLGLSIVKHIALLHGAQIELESAEGEGTRIAVTFPPQEQCP